MCDLLQRGLRWRSTQHKTPLEESSAAAAHGHHNAVRSGKYLHWPRQLWQAQPQQPTLLLLLLRRRRQQHLRE
jgi:hypothetical protein